MDCVRAVIPQADLDKFDELMSFKRKEILKVVAKGGGQEGQFREDNRTASHRYDSVEDDHSDLVADTHKNGHTGKRYLPGLPANEHDEHDTVDIINGVRNNRLVWQAIEKQSNITYLCTTVQYVSVSSSDCSIACN